MIGDGSVWAVFLNPGVTLEIMSIGAPSGSFDEYAGEGPHLVSFSSHYLISANSDSN